MIVIKELLSKKIESLNNKIANLDEQITKIKSSAMRPKSVSSPDLVFNEQLLSEQDRKKLKELESEKTQEELYLEMTVRESKIINAITVYGINMYGGDHEEILNRIEERPYIQFYTLDEFTNLKNSRKILNLVANDYEEI